jgi:hypothetical protein
MHQEGNAESDIFHVMASKGFPQNSIFHIGLFSAAPFTKFTGKFPEKFTPFSLIIRVEFTTILRVAWPLWKLQIQHCSNIASFSNLNSENGCKLINMKCVEQCTATILSGIQIPPG